MRFTSPRIPSKKPTDVRGRSPSGLFDARVSRALAREALRTTTSPVRAPVPESHTASTLRRSPWETCGPRWPRSSVQVRDVPGHRTEQTLTLNPRAGLMWP